MRTNSGGLLLAGVVGALAVLLVGCGNPSASVAPTSKDGFVTLTGTETPGQFLGCRPDLIEPISINWTDPPLGADVVPSVAEAAQRLAFVPREPQGLGPPDFIYVSQGAESDRSYRAVGFKYNVEPYGVVIVSMLLDPTPESAKIASWQSDVVKFNSGDPCYSAGHSELVTIKSNKMAYIGGPPVPPYEPRVSINWREGPVSIYVAGPNLTREQAIQIADAL